MFRGNSESGSLPVDGPGVSAVTDHEFVPSGEWWTRCGHTDGKWVHVVCGEVQPIMCGLAEAAHAATSLRRGQPPS